MNDIQLHKLFSATELFYMSGWWFVYDMKKMLADADTHTMSSLLLKALDQDGDKLTSRYNIDADWLRGRLDDLTEDQAEALWKFAGSHTYSISVDGEPAFPSRAEDIEDAD